MGKFYLTSYKDAVSIADVLEIYADLYDVFEDNMKIKKELDKVCDRLRELHSDSVQPEIIRCKDCKYYTSVTAQCEIRGKGLYLIRGMEDFCSRAERRTDG